MAESILQKSQLRLQLETGTHPTSGKPVFKSKTFANLKPEATAEQMLTVANALAGLQEYPLAAVERVDQSKIQA